jgi:hypothetical protein
VLPGRNCCGDNASCNSAESLTTALGRINRLERRLDYPIEFAAGVAQINAEFPVCVRIEWFGGSAHFVAVSAGWTSGGREVLVIEDPSYGQKTVFYDSFPSEYEGGGDWTHTYLTK